MQKKCIQIILIFAALLFLFSCKATSKIRKEKSKSVNVSNNEEGEKIKNNYYELASQKLGYRLEGNEDIKFLSNAIDWLGVPYRYGGCTKEGTDCSCFVITFYKEVYGIILPRKSEDMLAKSIVVERENLKTGDLLFFKIAGDKVSHVAIYISKGNFIHATTSKGVMINNLDENYYKKYYYKAGRFIF